MFEQVRERNSLESILQFVSGLELWVQCLLMVGPAVAAIKVITRMVSGRIGRSRAAATDCEIKVHIAVESVS